MTDQTEVAMASVVATAIRAPSMHNTQPWRFRVSLPEQDQIQGAVIEIWSDPSRRLPVADPTGWATRVACGAAALGAKLGVVLLGHRVDLSVLPQGVRQPRSDQPELVARLTVGTTHPATPQERELHHAIFRRRSNRYPFNETPAAPDVPGKLMAAARAEGAWLDVLDKPRQRAAVAGLVRQGQHRLAADPSYRAEFTEWVREASADRISPHAGDDSHAPQDGLLALRDVDAAARVSDRDFEPNPLVCVLGADTDRPMAQVRTGAALLRVLLAGTAIGLESSMLSQPIEVPELRRLLRAPLGRSVGWPQMVLRFGYGVRPPAAPRRPVSEVLKITSKAVA
ncbi:MAG: Acg family FMN-binding oxidoreductase [Micromonosporaceae bacterium]